MDKATNLKRRGFLISLGLGGAGAAAGVIGGAALMEKQSAPGGERESDKQTKGYRLTEHVKNYYRTTRI